MSASVVTSSKQPQIKFTGSAMSSAQKSTKSAATPMQTDATTTDADSQAAVTAGESRSLYILMLLLQYCVKQECCAIAKMSARRTVRQYAHGLKLESPFIPSSTDCWAVWAKIRQKQQSGGRRGEIGSRNMATTQKIERALVTSYRPCIVTFPLS